MFMAHKDTRTEEQKAQAANLILARNPRIYPSDAADVEHLIRMGYGSDALNRALAAAASPRSHEQYEADKAEERQNSLREPFEC